MKENLVLKNGIIIPISELKISTSKSGGPGGQHVNKTQTKVIIHWNIKSSNSLNDGQKELILKNLKSELTENGDLVIHNNSSRSQFKNKELAIQQLIKKINKSLYVPKKRIKMKMPEAIKEKRLESKKHRSFIKKIRSKKIQYD